MRKLNTREEKVSKNTNQKKPKKKKQTKFKMKIVHTSQEPHGRSQNLFALLYEKIDSQIHSRIKYKRMEMKCTGISECVTLADVDIENNT